MMEQHERKRQAGAKRAFIHERKGFSLLEVILALALVSLALVPITHNLAGSLKIEQVGQNLTQNVYLARAKMEELLNKDFESLADANGTVIMGNTLPWQAHIFFYDGDGDGDLDLDLKRVYLKVGEIEMETLRFQSQ